MGDRERAAEQAVEIVALMPRAPNAMPSWLAGAFGMSLGTVTGLSRFQPRSKKVRYISPISNWQP